MDQTKKIKMQKMYMYFFQYWWDILLENIIVWNL